MSQKSERQIPVFSVLKNNSIVKNIFLTEPPSLSLSTSSDLSTEKKDSGIDKLQSEEIFLVGRHPDCNVKLEHPSISRFHLRIHSIPSLQSLSVCDLSSVHGTWVCGNRIEPDIRVELHEGDTLQLGVSSRIYRLHWVPLSGIYDFSNPCLPTIDEFEPLEEKEEELSHKDESNSCGDHDLSVKSGGGDAEESEGMTFVSSGYVVEDEDRGEDRFSLELDRKMATDDGLEGLSLMFTDMNVITELNKWTPSETLMPADEKALFSCYVEAENEARVFCSTKLPFCTRGNEEEYNNCFNTVITDMETTLEHAEQDKKNPSDSCISEKSSQPKSPCTPSPQPRSAMSIRWGISENLMPTDEKSSFSCDVEVEKKAVIFGSSTFLQPDISPSAPLDPEGTESNIIVEYEEGNNNCLCTGITDLMQTLCTGITDLMQTTPENAEQNSSSNDSCISDKSSSQPKSPCTPSPQTRSVVSKRRGMSNCVQIQTHMGIGSRSSPFTTSDVKPLNHENLTTGPVPDKENCTPVPPNRSLKKNDNQTKVKCEFSLKTLSYSSDGENEDSFTPDKENISPATRLLMSMKKVEMKEVNSKTYRSPLKNVDSNVQKVIVGCKSNSSVKGIELRKLLHGKNTVRSASKSSKEHEPNMYASSKGSPDKAPLQSLSVGSDSVGTYSEASNLAVTAKSCSSSRNNPIVNMPIFHFNALEEKTKNWTMVVDTTCLLDKESLKALQLIQGLPKTNMIIPRTVIRKLDYLKRRSSLFGSTKQASVALQWIEDCVMNAQLGFHVQSTPNPNPIAYSFSCFDEEEEDKTKLRIGGYVPFFPTEDEILDCAIKLRRMNDDNERVILISDNMSLKIKAMAEGLLCETAKEFRESLVSPFSRRFMWPDSAPRGQTWTCIDKNKYYYYNGVLKKQWKSGQNTKGLKILLYS